jgi:predicted nucleotidyltransferase
MGIIEVIKKPEMRKIFGERELKIIEKQLKGVNLLPSERTRLSRDIRKKLEAVRILSQFTDSFKLKKGLILKNTINDTKKSILESELSKDVKRIILFGTAAENRLRLGSDIDITIELDKKADIKKATRTALLIAQDIGKNVEINIFNTLPEEIKDEIERRGKVIFEKKN